MSAPPTQLLLFASLCAVLWLFTWGGLWYGDTAASPHMWSSTAAGCEALAAGFDSSPVLPSRSFAGGGSGVMRPWVQQARDELASLSEHVGQLRCGSLLRPHRNLYLHALLAPLCPSSLLMLYDTVQHVLQKLHNLMWQLQQNSLLCLLPVSTGSRQMPSPSLSTPRRP